MLLAHPGIREAAVVVWEDGQSGEGRLTGYIVPDDDHVNRVFVELEDERNRLQKWRKALDLALFGKAAKSAQPRFDTAGWNSIYARKPIPAEEMQEWVDNTVSEIESLHPKQILEIGCGTGLLLLRIAPRSERYVAMDFSAAVLKKLKQHMEALGGAWDAVTLLERSAENFDGFVENSFDTVIINSVVQYFPNFTYLTRVLEEAVRVVRPGGKIFVGDVRNFTLLEAYAVSIELYHAPPLMRLGELRERVRHRIRFEEQLLVAPAFFRALRQRFPKISGVEIHPKRGRFDNEMTHFRYNAILNLGTQPEKVLEPAWQDWADQKLTLESIAGRLKEHRPEILAIKRIPNGRVERDLDALEILASSEASGMVGTFKESLEKLEHRGINPQEFWALGEELGYHVDLSWAASRPDGSYDVVFRRDTDGKLAQLAIEWPQAPARFENLAQYASSPGRAVLHEKLIEQLLDYSKEHLPEGMVPSAFIALDSLPLTADGAVNLDALPPPQVLLES